VLGIVENMSTFVCPDCGGTHDIFGSGGGHAFADETEMPFLGEIPIDPSVREGGDSGQPLVLDEDSDTGDAFRDVAARAANMQGILHRKRECGGSNTDSGTQSLGQAENEDTAEQSRDRQR
jgi:ATP-binding protein involved in chromosome partitioning